MKISHGLGLALLACFAFACGEGVPAEPEGALPRTPSAASAEGARRGAPADGNGTTGAPDEASTQGPNAAPTSSPSASPSPSPSPSSPSQPPIALTAQGTVGQKLFQDHCAGCHGGSVGISSFNTAADVASYVSANMPRNAPGSLTQNEYFSIVAFDLTANGVDLRGQTLDASNAGSVTVR